jgi:hypothetical protein
MPDKVYLDDNGEPIDGGGAFASVQSGSSSAAPKVYLDDNGEPIDRRGKQGVLAGAQRELQGQWDGIKMLGESAVDVSKNLLAGGDTAKATMGGFGQGAKEGVKALIDNPVESLDPTGGVAIAKSDDDTSTKIGRAGVLAAESALPFLKPLQRLKGLAKAAKGVPPGVPGGHLVKVPTRQTISGVLEDVRKPAQVPSVELPPPVKQPAVSYPRGAAPSAEPSRPVAAPRKPTKPVAAEAPVAAPDASTAVPSPVKAPFEGPVSEANAAHRAEMAYEGPDRRVSGTRQSFEDQHFQDLRARLAKGEPVGSPEARADFNHKQAVDRARKDKAAERGEVDTRDGDTPAPTPELPASWQKLVTPETPAAKPGVRNIPGIVSKVTLKPGVAADARRALGSKKAAAHLNRLGLTEPLTPQMVKDMAPGPSRTPLIATNAELDAKYRSSRGQGRESGASDHEAGFIDPAVLRTMGGAAAGGAGLSMMADKDHKVGAGVVGALTGAAAMNPMKTLSGLQKVRVMGMLSGAALPKSLAGNAGAFATAAAEKGSMAPIREALRVPTNAKNAVHAWKNNANPAHIAGVGRFNLPARAMGALDQTTTKALERAGLSLEEAQRLLLTNPNTLGAGNLGRAMKGKIGMAAFPFQNTPMNAVAEGVKSLDGMFGTGITGQPKHNLTQKALTAGAIGGGAAAGEMTDDPRALALMAAFAGPRGIPFALGAGTTAGSRVIEKIGVGLPDGAWKDFVDPEQAARPITDPAILRFIEWLKGRESR